MGYAAGIVVGATVVVVVVEVCVVEVDGVVVLLESLSTRQPVNDKGAVAPRSVISSVVTSVQVWPLAAGSVICATSEKRTALPLACVTSTETREFC